jgi:hypothetical protein
MEVIDTLDDDEHFLFVSFESDVHALEIVNFLLVSPPVSVDEWTCDGLIQCRLEAFSLAPDLETPAGIVVGNVGATRVLMQVGFVTQRRFSNHSRWDSKSSWTVASLSEWYDTGV